MSNIEHQVTFVPACVSRMSQQLGNEVALYEYYLTAYIPKIVFALKRIARVHWNIPQALLWDITVTLHKMTIIVHVLHSLMTCR